MNDFSACQFYCSNKLLPYFPGVLYIYLHALHTAHAPAHCARIHMGCHTLLYMPTKNPADLTRQGSCAHGRRLQAQRNSKPNQTHVPGTDCRRCLRQRCGLRGTARRLSPSRLPSPPSDVVFAFRRLVAPAALWLLLCCVELPSLKFELDVACIRTYVEYTCHVFPPL